MRNLDDAAIDRLKARARERNRSPKADVRPNMNRAAKVDMACAR